MEEKKRCPHCGKEILAVAKKCKHCGKWIDNPKSDTKITVSKKRVIYGLMLLVAFIAGVCLLLTINKGEDDARLQPKKEDPIIRFAEPEGNEDGAIGKEYASPSLDSYESEDYTKYDEESECVVDSAAADSVDTMDYLSIGETYEKGIGREVNLAKAFYYYELAAENGDPTGLNKLGNMYAKGIGCNKDIYKAAKYYLLAAEKGNKFAQHNIAFCYWDGVGIEKDRKKAVMWMRRSAAQGFDDAKKALKIMGVE